MLMLMGIGRIKERFYSSEGQEEIEMLWRESKLEM